jgi:hypothetical protein
MENVMRLATLLCLLPLPVMAGANPEAVYNRLITGTWAETAEACTADDGVAYFFFEGGLTLGNEGGETCAFDYPGTDSGVDVVLDVLCVMPGEEPQHSARRIWIDLESISPGMRNPGDRLTLTDQDRDMTLQRCP